MKLCPVCRSTYADDSLRYCLQDGAALESVSAGAAADEFKTLVLPENVGGGSASQPTEIMDLGSAATVPPRQPAPTVPQRPRDTNPVTSQPTPGQTAPRSTASIVALTIAATVALLALGGLTAWLLLGNKRDDGAANISQHAPDNQNNALPNSNTRPPNANASPSPSPSVTPKPSPTASATPATPSAAEEREVRAALNGWLNSFRARDLDAYMARYADELDAYYRARSVSVERVRGDKARAFAKYTSIEVWLDNIDVRVDSSGTRAVATFNKRWRFNGPGVSTYEGSGFNRFTFTKMGGQWLITGEEDL